MPVLLFSPFLPALFWLRNSEGFRVQNYSGIFFCSNAVNEQVIVSAGNMIDRRESLVLKKKIFSVCKIPAHTHVRFSGQCISKILKCGMKSFETNDLIE